MGMTAHVVYTAIDPDNAATVSPDVMAVIRDDIGFGGLMMTDDISMEALSGSVAERSAAAIAAGCDLVLHSNGKLPEMAAVVSASGAMTPLAVTRSEAALSQRRPPRAVDIRALDAELAALLAAE